MTQLPRAGPSGYNLAVLGIHRRDRLNAECARISWLANVDFLTIRE